MKYSIDSMIMRRNRVFGFGWVFHPEETISSISLEITLTSGKAVLLPITYNKLREDVATAFPDQSNARQAGFFLYSGWSGSEADQATLIVIASSGKTFRLAVPFINLRPSDVSNVSVKRSFSTSMLKGWHLMREGRVTRLHQKARNLLVEKCKQYANPLKKHSDLFKLIDNELVRAKSSKTLLLIDHSLGGGANHYRERLIDARLKNAQSVFLFTYYVASLQYVLEIHTILQKRRFPIDGIDVLFSLIEEFSVDEIFYNDAVSFDRPENVPDFLTAICRRRDILLTVAIHDYFSICPSQFLLNKNERYCGIPDTNICATCLPKNNEGFATLFEAADITVWRKKWGECLERADRILCFSNSSKTLLRRAYPRLAGGKIEVCPHSVMYLPLRQPRIASKTQLHLGVVGAINVHKGARVIRTLAEEIISRGIEVHITIIGSIELACDSRVVSETGPYEHAQLVELIEKTGVNLFFLPSICPETFSYVTQELILLNMPVACFDLGAPAERLCDYPRGKVISFANASEVLDALLDFHAEQKDVCVFNISEVGI